MTWFPVGLKEEGEKWRFDIIALLAVIGSSAIEKHIHAITASPFAAFPRLLPAPETLLNTERPSRPPSVKDVKIVGVKSGTEFDELNFFANLIHNVESLGKYEFKVYELEYTGQDAEHGAKTPAMTGAPQGPSRLEVPIKLRTFCWLNAVTLLSILITIGLFIWAGCEHDGTALLGLGTMSLSTSAASLSARWYPRLTGRTAHAKVPNGDVIIRTRAGAFILVRGNENVIRELYGGMEDCKYMYNGKPHHLLLATSTVCLMASIILLSNCRSVMQIAIGVAYVILNILYWLLALLVEPRDIWDMSRYNIRQTKHYPSMPCSNYTETLWLAINASESIEWVVKGEFAPSTPAWDQWLQEAKDHIGKEWDAVRRKDELMNPGLAFHMSNNLVPLTVIKGAGHEFIPLPQGENATTADFHSIRTKTESPAYFTSGFYKIEAGPQRPAHYTFEETKYVLSGQIDVFDEATGVTHHLVPGDFAFFHVGSKVKFSTKSQGFAFYAVTRPVRAPHPNLVGREEDKAKL